MRRDREPGPNDDLWAGVIVGLFGGVAFALILVELLS